MDWIFSHIDDLDAEAAMDISEGRSAAESISESVPVGPKVRDGPGSEFQAVGILIWGCKLYMALSSLIHAVVPATEPVWLLSWKQGGKGEGWQCRAGGHLEAGKREAESGERREGLCFFLPVVLGWFSVPIEQPGCSLCAESVPRCWVPQGGGIAAVSHPAPVGQISSWKREGQVAVTISCFPVWP